MKYLILFLTFLLFSCSSREFYYSDVFNKIDYHQNNEKRIIVYANVLRNVLTKNFKNAHVRINDSVYAIASKEWLNEYNNKFSEHFEKFKYNKSFDCDNYSIAYHSIAQELHANEKYWGVEGLGVGKLFYYKIAFKMPLEIAKEQIDDKERFEKLEKDEKYAYIRQGHAINIVMIKESPESDGFQLIFIEPQSGKEVLFTQKDIDTVFFVEF